uniref:Ion transport domain-containing protein n=1 Tax=Palpitomonas bilix TaxID=652834 RepID=A0A7S3G720_9EUKA
MAEVGAGAPVAVVVGEPSGSTAEKISKKPKRECCICCTKCRKGLATVASKDWFDYFFLSIVLLNTVAMALEFHRMPDLLIKVLMYANYTFTALFLVEFVVKFIGFGPKGYFQDRLNILDFIVVLASLVEVSLDVFFALQASSGDSGADGLSTVRVIRVLRLFRVLRVTKIVRHMESMRTIINTILQSIPSFAYIALLLVLLMFMYAVMGMQLFGGKFYFPYEEERRAHFDTFLWAFVTVFQIITLEGWVQVMFDAVRVTSTAAALYFATLVLIGIYILLNLFLAVLLENESLNDTIKEQAEKRQREKKSQQKAHVPILGNILVEPPEDVEKVHAPSIRGDEDAVEKGLITLKSMNGVPTTKIAPLPDIQGQTPVTVKAGDLSLNLKSKGARSMIQSGSGATTDTPRLDGEGKPNHTDATADSNNNEKRQGDASDGEGSNNADKRKDSQSWALPGVPEETALANLKRTISKASDNDGEDASRPESNTSDSQAPTLKSHSYDAELGNGRAVAAGAPTKRSVSIESGVSRQSVEESKIPEFAKHRALFFLKPHYKFRIFMMRVASAKAFETIMLIAVIVSSLLLAVDTPALSSKAYVNVSGEWVFVPEHWYRLVLDIVDYFFTGLFTFELVVRVLAMGLVMHKGSYWRDSWNILDTLIVVVSLMSTGELADVSYLKAFRVMKALRPLRAIRRVKSMRLVVGALFRSVKSIFNVMLVCVMVWLIFGILGVELMKGKFAHCDIPNWNGSEWEQSGFETRVFSTDDSFLLSAQSSGNVVWANETCRGDECLCPSVDGVQYWINHPFNFDNLGIAFMSLFVVATSEGWLEIMYSATDGWEEDRQPIKNSNEYLAFFFMLFMIIGSYMFLNLFSSTIFLHYHEAKERDSGLSELNKKQVRFVEMNKLAMKTKLLRLPDVPTKKWRRFFFRITEHGAFTAFIMICIVLNIILMSLSFYDESCEWKTVQEVLNFVFTIIFTFEAIFKLIAYGVKGYFREGWNRFDFFIVVGSAVDMGMTLGFNSTLACDPGEGAVDTSILRLFRIQRLLRVSRASRVLRLAHGLKGMNELFSVISAVLPSMYSNASVLGLLLFVYAVLGINLFYYTEYTGEIYRQANFRDIFMAFLTLLRCLTGEDWNEVMQSTGGDVASIAYFLSFVILGQLVMMNMVLAAVVDAFDAMSTGETPASAIVEEEERRKKAKEEVFARRSRKRIRRKKELGIEAVDEEGNEIMTAEEEHEMEKLEAKWEAYEDKLLVGPATRDDFRQYATLWSKLDPKGTGYILLKELPKVLDGPHGAARLFGLHPLEELEWRAKGNGPRRGLACEAFEEYKGIPKPPKGRKKKVEVVPDEPDLHARALRWVRLLTIPVHRRSVNEEGESESFLHFREIVFALVDFRWRVPLPPNELADEVWAARIIGCPSLRPPNADPNGDIIVGGRVIKKGKKRRGGQQQTAQERKKKSAATFDNYISTLKLNRPVQKLVVEEDMEDSDKTGLNDLAEVKKGKKKVGVEK